MADTVAAAIDEVEVDQVEIPEEDEEPQDLNSALQQVLKRARYHKGLCRGLRETVKALDKRVAHLCVLAEDCSEGGYVALIEALCSEHGIDLIKVWLLFCIVENMRGEVY